VPEWTTTGDYTGDPEFAERFRAWMGKRWAVKDAAIERIRGEDGEKEPK
jgi:hypothetical protein